MTPKFGALPRERRARLIIRGWGVFCHPAKL
jgi:hypothetical protein